MASANSSTTNGDNAGASAAQLLMKKHDEEAHKVSVEDVPDEEDLTNHPHPLSSSVLESTDEPVSTPEWAAPMSAKAAGKRKEETGKESKATIDTQSDELFPGLGGAPKAQQPAYSAPIWGARKGAGTNGNAIATKGSSTPKSGMNTPPIATKPTGVQSLAGQVAGPVYTFEPKELPRSATRKPLPDVLRDINKKFRTNLTQTTGEGGVIKISAPGSQVPDSVKRQAFKELGSNITTKTSTKVPFPRSARAHVIGKGGSTIKSLQEQSGARIQLPKAEDTPEPVDDDDDMIYIAIEGNPIAVQIAKESVGKIASERSASVNAKLRTIPAELYQFIAGPNNSRVNALEEAHGVQVRVPAHHVWTLQAPPKVPSTGEAPVFLPAAGDNHITVTGDRLAVQAARNEIERLSQDLQRQMSLQQEPISKGRHQFIISDSGFSAQDFFAETGCAIILPPANNENDIVTVVGPPEKLQGAADRTMKLASELNNEKIELLRLLRNAPSPGDHARNLTHYLRDRNELARIEKLHEAHIFTLFGSDGTINSWDLYARNGVNGMKAQSEIRQVLDAHPPTRVKAFDVDEFFHKQLQSEFVPRVKKDYGVHLVVPKKEGPPAPVVLVFEGEDVAPEYTLPKGQPSAEDVKLFKQQLDAAEKHIQDIINAQGKITETKIDVPQIFHNKLRKYITVENSARQAGQFPVRVSARGTVLTFFGPKPAVESLTAKVNAFVRQAFEDEKERGFTLSFDFPQKHANQLIGKSGSNISELRDRFDVDIQVNDGVVELKGPKVKAEAAKSHISALGRQWADETTYVLKIAPKYHSELIGSGGSQIKKLERKYKNVQIRFPHSARPVADDQSNADGGSEEPRRNGRREQEPDEVIVRGPKKGADEVKSEILDLLQYTMDTSHSETVSVQAGQIPSLIGSRGAEMDKVRQETGAKIDIPNARDIKDPSTRVEIQIKGTKTQVTQAKKMIEEKKDVFDKTVTKTLEVDKKHHKALIGSKGGTIGEIVLKAGGSNTPGQTVQFPKADADDNAIRVTGTVEVVDKIIETILHVVSDLASRTTEVIDVPTDKHRSLIGRGGETKRDLESKFQVSIDIPRQNSEETDVKISGLPANVENAKSHILNLVKEQEGETMQVPRSVHHSVSDNGQFFRQLRNNHRVTVDVNRNDVPPRPSAPSSSQDKRSMPLITDDEEDVAGSHDFRAVNLAGSDLEGELPWTLRGTPDNVAKARAIIAAAIEQALRSDIIGYLTLPDPQTYKYVIGQGGKQVNSIRQATGCKITVPRDQNRDEAIEIVGSAEGVEHARDLILEAVEKGRNNTNGRS
ncbi:putative KH domain-containing protein [Amylocarpus encephaloides]|uniref:KH domain-containing protein n=1 Tax=Amylocarpus encephaloides TaxID=45428 RepID=A0A9P7YRZ6_9HELO|nr:putative KH domain-containing protein [Amylocarpus encephaloides]